MLLCCHLIKQKTITVSCGCTKARNIACMKWNPAKRQSCFLLYSFYLGLCFWKTAHNSEGEREASLCLETRRGKVFAVTDCRIVVKFDMPISYRMPHGAPRCIPQFSSSGEPAAGFPGTGVHNMSTLVCNWLIHGTELACGIFLCYRMT